MARRPLPPRVPLPRNSPSGTRPYPPARTSVAPPALRQREPGRPPAAPALPQSASAFIRPPSPDQGTASAGSTFRLGAPQTGGRLPGPPRPIPPSGPYIPPHGGPPSPPNPPRPQQPRPNPPRPFPSPAPPPPTPAPAPVPTTQARPEFPYDPYRPLYGVTGPPLTAASQQPTGNPCLPNQVWDENKGICRAPVQELECCPANLPPGLHCPTAWPPCPGQGGPPPPPPPPPGGNPSCPPPNCQVQPDGQCKCTAPPGGGGPPPPPPPPPPQQGPCPGTPCPPGCNCDGQSGVCDCTGPQQEGAAPPGQQSEGTIFDSQGGFAGEMWPDFQGGGGKAPGEMWPDVAQPQGGPSAKGEMWPDLQAPAPKPVSTTAKYPYIPSAQELAGLPPGTSVETPWGIVEPDPSGEPRLVMNAQGQAAYSAARARSLAAWGPTPFSGRPGVPNPPVAVGKPNYNPFTGMWS